MNFLLSPRIRRQKSVPGCALRPSFAIHPLLCFAFLFAAGQFIDDGTGEMVSYFNWRTIQVEAIKFWRKTAEMKEKCKTKIGGIIKIQLYID